MVSIAGDDALKIWKELLPKGPLLVLGRAGCGKTTLLLELYCRATQAQLDSSEGSSGGILFLLPTYSQVEHIKDVIIRRGFAAGFVGEGIYSFSQLARETLGYYGLKGPISALEKGIILREVFDYKGRSATGAEAPLPLKYFEGREGFPGVQVALLSFFKELKEDGQYPADFRNAVDKFLKKNPTHSPDKYVALAEAYTLYQEALGKRGLLDEDDLLNQLLGGLEADKTLLSQTKLLLVDGFHDFTPVEFRLLKLLIKKIPGVIVSLPLEGEKATPRQEAVFAHCRELYKEFKKMGLRPIVLEEARRFRSGSLTQIEKGLFDPAAKPIEADSAIEVIEATDIRDEVEQIARRIYRMASGGEAAYQDIVIVFRDVTPYRDILKAVFREYNIPVRIYARWPLIENPLVKGILSLLKVITGPWKDEEVLEVLKSPYLMLPQGEVDLLEHKVLQWGRLDSREVWLRLISGKAFKSLSKTREFISYLAEGGRELEGVHPASFFRAWLLKLINNFFSLSGVMRCREEAPGSQREDEDLLREEAGGLRAFLDLVERQCQVADAPLSFGDFLEELQANVSTAHYTVRDKRHEVVNVIDALEARQWEKPVVFVGGLLERQFPKQAREDIFLKDTERRAFRKLTGVNLQEALRRSNEEERFLFYVALTRARRKLTLSYPASDDRGRPTLPSFYLEEVKGLFTGESCKAVSVKRTPLDFIPGPEDILTQRDLRNFLFYHLTSPYLFKKEGSADMPGVVPPHELALGLYNRELTGGTAWLEDLRVAMGRPEEGKPQAVELLREIITTYNATQLSHFSQCPFLHFCRWILKINPSPNKAEEGLNALLQGDIVHEVLMHYYYVLKRGRGANIETLFEESFGRKTMGIPMGFSEARIRREMLQSVKAVVEQDKEYIARSSFHPRYLEIVFGESAMNRGFAEQNAPLPTLVLSDSKGEKFKLKGRIDRIDVAEIGGETLGLVIDYKYTDKIKRKKLIDEMREGTDLQLFIYVMVAGELLGLRAVGAQLYYAKIPERSGITVVPLPYKCESLSVEEMEDLLETCKANLFKQIEGILAGGRSVSPRDLGFCQRLCDYNDVCRLDEGRARW